MNKKYVWCLSLHKNHLSGKRPESSQIMTLVIITKIDVKNKSIRYKILIYCENSQKEYNI